MASRDWIESLAQANNVRIHIWGRFGREYRDQIESELGVKLSEQMAEFVDTIGNVSLFGTEILVTGVDDNWNCIRSTFEARDAADWLPRTVIRIVNDEVDMYFESDSGNIVGFESVPFEPYLAEELERFEDLNSYIEHLISLDAEPNPFDKHLV